MDIAKAFILGIIEGITEFLPVSSTGHLILAGDLLGFTGEKAKVFEVFIQLGAILAVVWLYRERVLSSVKSIGTKKTNQSLLKTRRDRFLLNIFIAFLPAAFFGLLTHSFIKHYLFNPITVASALILGGIVMLVVERIAPNPMVVDVDEVSVKKAFGIGMAQVLSLFPGVSRAGATIMGGMILKLDRKTATEFSFFLAIPTMFAATAYDLLKSLHSLSTDDISIFAIGFITSFFSALVVIKAFIRFIAGHNFNSFAVYRIIFGAAILFYYT
ncbi:MAG: undecaprenyl-diphosphate phosphatase [Deltaproteobacteria bacterium]|nr:undecaprenyl-diphosphate phosphatase [Deltaproteobacteria bacterium]